MTSTQLMIGKNFDGTGVFGPAPVAGTPSGAGMACRPPLWTKDGDTIEIERIGQLHNRIVAEVR